MQCGASDGSNRIRTGGIFGTVSTVPRRHRYGHAWVAVVLGIDRSFATELRPTVAVADHIGTELDRFVHGGSEVGEVARVRFDQKDVTIRADGADHVEVQ